MCLRFLVSIVLSVNMWTLCHLHNITHHRLPCTNIQHSLPEHPLCLQSCLKMVHSMSFYQFPNQCYLSEVGRGVFCTNSKPQNYKRNERRTSASEQGGGFEKSISSITNGTRREFLTVSGSRLGVIEGYMASGQEEKAGEDTGEEK